MLGSLVRFPKHALWSGGRMNSAANADLAYPDEVSEMRRMAGLGRLVWGVAHEFNNILSTILCCSHLLERRWPRNEALWRETAEIRAAVHQGEQLARLLQAYLRRDPPRPESVDLDSYLLRLVRVSQQAGGGIPALRLVGRGQPMRVYVDLLEFTEVMFDIFAAVRKAVSEGGEIALEASEAPGLQAQVMLDVPAVRPDIAWPGHLTRLVERLAATTAFRAEIVPATDSALRLRICLPLDSGKSG